MKEQKHIWEADVRQQVKGHVFDYDPDDWNEMEQLLNQAGTPAPDVPPPSPGAASSGFWKTGFFTLLVLSILAIWFLLTLPNPNGPDSSGRQMSAFPLPALDKMPTSRSAETIRDEPSVVKESEPGKIPARTVAPSNNQPLTIPLEKLETPETLIENKNDEAVEMPKRETIELVTPLFRSSEIPLLQADPRPLDVEIPTLRKPKRKRDRRKLYPDVFDNY